MHVLIVNHCPPSAHNALLAWQCVQQASRRNALVSVFFDGDGVSHAQPSAALEPEILDLHQAYRQLQLEHDNLRLLVCRAALARRTRQALPQGWRLSGLPELVTCTEQAGHVLSFAT